ncbi:MAG: site-2 protease family protein [Acidimicrobiia bacterium]
MRFTIFGIPIHIRFTFWIVAAIIFPFQLSVLSRSETWPFLAAWLVVVAVSVIAHELGHAVVARRFGAEVDMTLYALGGFTRWATTRPMSPWRRVLVAAAGSSVGFVLGGIVFFALRSGTVPTEPRVLNFALESFWQVNVLWGVLNWLPIRPLDGGHIFLGSMQAMLGRRGERVADVVFPVVTIAGGLYAFTEGFVIAALFAAFILMDEVRRWGASRPKRRSAQPEAETPFTLFGDD